LPGFLTQDAYDVRFEWGERGLRALAGDARVFVIVDVLRFTTCVSLACARGAAVLPFRWKDARVGAYAAEHDALVAGAGERYSLSPASLVEIPAGTRIVLPSPNGSALSLEAAARGEVLAGCLRNASAVAARAAALGGPVAVIAAGERWSDGSLRAALEDQLGAGAVIARLPGTPSPEARHARAAFALAARDLDATLRGCASGRELLERGWANDLPFAAALDVDPVAPLLRDAAYVA
jgi:2-phosphosulfolactate phosphatase